MEWDETEARLEGRSRERREALAKRDRRRRLVPWLVCPLLAAAGAAGLVALAQEDLRPLGVAAVCVAVPALIAGWVGRAHGWIDAVLWALVTAAVAVAAATAYTLLVGSGV